MSVNQYKDGELVLLAGAGSSEGNILDTIEEINSNTQSEKIAGALAVKELLGGVRFGTDGDGNYGYYKADDSFVPFKGSGLSFTDWILAGGLNPTDYGSLYELLEDEAAVRTLMTKKTAVDVLANLSENDLRTIINHRYAAKWINYREYAYSTLSDSTLAKALMDESDMYGMYITTESKNKPLVPVLTSNTGSDGGEVIYSSLYVPTGGTMTYVGYGVFDENDNTSWARTTSSTEGGAFIGYKFTKPTKVNSVYVYCGLDNTTITAKIQYSDDGSKWEDALDNIVFSKSDKYTLNISDSDYHLCWRLYYASSTANTRFATQKLQFYGYQLEGLIPTMTSDTSSSGEVICTTPSNTSNPGFKSFDGNDTTYYSAAVSATSSYVGYKFNVPTKVKVAKHKCGASTKSLKFQYSDDGSIWYDASNLFESSGSTTDFYELNDNLGYHLYWRLYWPSSAGTSYELQFYNENLWQPKGLVPMMTSDTAPYGEAFASSVYTGTSGTYYAWKAFDGKLEALSMWHSTANTGYIGYKFTSPTCIKKFSLTNRIYSDDTTSAHEAKEITLMGSNDGSTWDDISGVLTNTSGYSLTNWFDVDNDSYYLYYKLDISSSYGTRIVITDLQFYGRQLEALIPPMTSNTAPSGEASATSTLSSSAAYKAFNGASSGESNSWLSDYGSSSLINDQRLIYRFYTPISLKCIIVEARRSKDIAIEVSSNGINWTTVKEWTQSSDTLTNTVVILDKPITCQYISYLGKTSHITGTQATPHWVQSLQVYGSPDYESRTYIYDHGVEVMEVNAGNCSSTYGTETKESDYLSLKATGTNVVDGNALPQFYTDKIDLTNYKMFNAKTDNILVIGTDTRWGGFGISNTLPHIPPASWTSVATITKPDNNIIDLSSVNSSLGVVLFVNGGSTTMTISEWWLE